jgi:hypothetical protein
MAPGRQLGEHARHLRGPEPVRVGLAAALRERAQEPMALGMLGARGIVILTKRLTHLVHQPEVEMRATDQWIFL